MNNLKVGDTIKCHEKEDAVNTMIELGKAGVQTDFDYSDGINLVVTEVEDAD